MISIKEGVSRQTDMVKFKVLPGIGTEVLKY